MNTAAPHTGTFAGSWATLEKWPSNPEMEFTRMKGAEIADAARISDQPIYSRSGLRNIPPPTPVRPDRNPIAAPEIIAAQRSGGFGSLTTGLSEDRNIKTAA